MPQNDLKMQEFQWGKLLHMITNEDIAVALSTLLILIMCALILNSFYVFFNHRGLTDEHAIFSIFIFKTFVNILKFFLF